MFRFRLCLIALSLVINSTALAKMYKWVDENGVTQFSTFPPANTKKDYQTLSSASQSKKNVKQYIKGIWQYQKNNQHYKMTINDSGINLSELSDNATSANYKSIMRASWKLSGKTLTLKYKNHKNSALIGTSEVFFVVKINETDLTLISNKTNTKTQYQRNNSQNMALLQHSPLMQQLVGHWTGSTEKNDIQFSNNGTFTISGYLEKKWAKMYTGDWEYNDPDILFHFESDKVIPSGRISKIGKTERYRIVKLTNDSLHIRSIKTGTIKKYLRNNNQKARR